MTHDYTNELKTITEIEKKYPKAFDKFIEWLVDDKKAQNIYYHYDGLSNNEIIGAGYDNFEDGCSYARGATMRDLYDFFDEQEIIISINSIIGSDKTDWRWTIYNYKTVRIYGSELTFNTRTEAEQESFTKAFEILEERLK